MHKLSITLSTHYQSKNWRRGDYNDNNFNSLFNEHVILEDKNTAPCFSMAHLSGNRRKNDFVIGMFGIVYDFDYMDDGSYQTMLAHLQEEGIRSVMYTTYSHKNKRAKGDEDGDTKEFFRIVLPFSEEYNSDLSKKTWQSIHGSVAETYGLQGYDKTSGELARLYFKPSKPTKNAPSRLDFVSGVCVVPDPKDFIHDLTIDYSARDVDLTFESDGVYHDIGEWWKGRQHVPLADLISQHQPNKIVQSRDLGGFIIECPFQEEHSHTPTTDTATFVDNPNDTHDHSTIKCLHEHCMDRKTDEFVHKMLVDGWIDFSAFTEEINYLPGIPNNVTHINDNTSRGIQAARDKQDDVRDRTKKVSASTMEDALPDIADIKFDAELFKKTIGNDKELAFALSDATTQQQVLAVAKNKNELEMIYCWAKSAVKYDWLPKDIADKILQIRYSARGIRKDITTVLRMKATAYSVAHDVEQISELYNLTIKETEEAFVKERKIKLIADWEWEHKYEFNEFSRVFDMLDTNYLVFMGQVVNKANTGLYYIDGEKQINTFEIAGEKFTAATLENRHVRVVASNRADGTEINVVEYWLSLPRLRDNYEFITCSPNKRKPSTVYNTYNPDKGVQEVACDTQRFYEKELSLFKEVLTDGDTGAFNYILTWLAHTHQFPDKKMPTTMFFEGVQGAGKSILLSTLFVNPHGVFGITTSDIDGILGNFNSHIASKYMCFVDEISTPLDFDKDGHLKYLITSPFLDITFKGKDTQIEESYHHFVFASNNGDIVNINDRDRRLSYFKVGDKYANNPRFWAETIPKLSSSLFNGRLKHFLMHFKPEDYGCSFMDITRPYENEHVVALRNQAENIVEEFFVMLAVSGTWEQAFNAGVDAIAWPIEGSKDNFGVDSMLETVSAYASFNRKQVNPKYLPRMLDRFCITYLGASTLASVVEKGIVVLPSRRSVVDKLHKNGVISTEQQLAAYSTLNAGTFNV